MNSDKLYQRQASILVFMCFREKDIREAETVCGGKGRIRHVYLSHSHRVEIRLFARKKSSDFPYFMLKYEGKEVCGKI